MEDKAKIRETYLKIRHELGEKLRYEKNKLIRKTIEELERFKQAEHVLFYYAIKKEVSTHELLTKYLSLKTLYLPKILSSEHFEAIRVRAPLTLEPGLKGVPEPEKGEKAERLDLVLVPGVVFDKKGHRLGTGKGYYDRFLIQYPKSFKIGLAYEEQVVENLPQNPYDVPMNLIITDQNIYFSS